MTTLTWSDCDYPGKLLNGIGGVNGKFCDINVRVGEHTYCLHKLVLYSGSGYFKTMLDEQKRTGNVETIEINNMDDAMFMGFMNYLYTGELEVDLDQTSLSDVYRNAHFLTIPTINDWCVTEILDTTNVTNCLQYAKLAEEFSLEAMKDNCEEVIVNNFSEVSQQQDFLNIQAECLKRYLNNENLDMGSEMEKFTILRNWMQQHEDDAEAIEAAALMLEECISFEKMSAEEITEVMEMVRTMGDKYVTFFKKCLQEAQKVGWELPEFPLPPCILILGGSQLDPTRHKPKPSEAFISVQMYKLSDVSDPMTPDNLPEGLRSPSVVTVNKYVYVIGGAGKVWSKGVLDVKKTLHRYDTKARQWLSLAEMHNGRFQASAFIIGGAIYVAGGKNAKGVLGSMERYHLAEDEWEYSYPLPVKLCEMACCVLDGLAYVSGGRSLNHGPPSADLHLFVPETGSWSLRGRMINGRRSHGMCTDGNRLYILGGIGGGGVTLQSAEVYDSKSAQFTVISNMPYIRCSTNVLFYEDKIYMPGGWGRTRNIHSKEFPGPTNTVLIYDIDEQTWIESPTMLSRAVAECSCALVILPQQIGSDGSNTHRITRMSQTQMSELSMSSSNKPPTSITQQQSLARSKFGFGSKRQMRRSLPKLSGSDPGTSCSTSRNGSVLTANSDSVTRSSQRGGPSQLDRSFNGSRMELPRAQSHPSSLYMDSESPDYQDQFEPGTPKSFMSKSSSYQNGIDADLKHNRALHMNGSNVNSPNPAVKSTRFPVLGPTSKTNGGLIKQTRPNVYPVEKRSETISTSYSGSDKHFGSDETASRSSASSEKSYNDNSSDESY